MNKPHFRIDSISRVPKEPLPFALVLVGQEERRLEDFMTNTDVSNQTIYEVIEGWQKKHGFDNEYAKKLWLSAIKHRDERKGHWRG